MAYTVKVWPRTHRKIHWMLQPAGTIEQFHI